MRLIFCPLFPNVSLGMFMLSGNDASKQNLLLLYILWDATFQSTLAMHKIIVCFGIEITFLLMQMILKIFLRRSTFEFSFIRFCEKFLHLMVSGNLSDYPWIRAFNFWQVAFLQVKVLENISVSTQNLVYADKNIPIK